MIEERKLGATDKIFSFAAQADTIPNMAIRFTVDEVAKREGIKTAYALAAKTKTDKTKTDKTKLSYEAVRALWRNESKMVALATLERLCEVLNVSAGQLIEYTPDPPVEPKPAKKSKPKAK
jgi:DNA-binding Xre family transcriptional regulator